MKERNILQAAGIGFTILALLICVTSCNQEETKPNVLFIFTDQQTLTAMSATGNPYLNTPALDRLASRGVMFTNSYCTSPVCGPSRSSLLTGLMPHTTEVNFNGQTPISDFRNMGELFRAAGYNTKWAGKWHLPASYPARDRAKDVRGFEVIPFFDTDDEGRAEGERSKKVWSYGNDTDGPLATAAIDFIRNKHETPFLLAISFHNPHDICFYVRDPDMFTPLSETETFPPLPENNAVAEDEPELVQLCRIKDAYGFENLWAKDFTDENWRGYLYDYYRLTEAVDKQVGRVIDALEQEGLMENTLIVFTSDHGDGAASHKWHSKLSLYEGPATVPFIISYGNIIPKGIVDNKHLVSGLDLLPTLCDYAGVEIPDNVIGSSIRPIIENYDLEGNEFVVTELAPFYKGTLEGKYRDWRGRMVRTIDYKYCVYNEGERNEQLFDMNNDRGETTNLAYDPDMASVIEYHRELLKGWLVKTDDNFILPE